LSRIEVSKFNAKLISKLIKEALPQLASFHDEVGCEIGTVFIWTPQIIDTPGTRAEWYRLLETQIKKYIDTSELAYDVHVFVIFSNPLDLWDFTLTGGKRG
jgi:hypothetical protein